MKPKLLFVLAAGLLLAADPGKQDPGQKDLDKMQGDWALASMTRDGMKVPDLDVQALFRSVKGNEYTIFRFERVVGKGTFKVDTTKKPKTIDLFQANAPADAKPVLGIYEFDGDELRVCYAPPGKDRPKAFESKPGQAQTLAVWEPEKK